MFGEGLTVTFHGVRGSTPCCSPDLCHFGGNTSCVVVELEGHEPIIFDMGTGLRSYGADRADQPFEGSILLTHLHWDHVQGLPFFKPLHVPGSRVDVYGPPEDGKSLGELFSGLMCTPYFPIGCGDVSAEVSFTDASSDRFTIGDAEVLSRPVPHTGATNGYRVEIGGRKIAYISDHQQPVDDPTFVDEGVLELADGVDLLIHDAQYTPEQFQQRALWGHSTMDYACEVARQAEAEALVLFHHDPDNTDARLSALVEQTQRYGESLGLAAVIGAREGESVKFD